MNFKYYLSSTLLIIALVFGFTNTNAQVTVTSSDSLSCTVPCTLLTAHLTGDTPTDAGVTSDDVYSGLHAIGFSFDFYGVSYTQCVLGANGTIDFNVGDAGMGDPWPITAPLLGNASKFNNICGPWCDIDIFYTGIPVGTETYSTDGVAPFRKFVVTWCATSMFSCGTQLTTSQIILYETTNIIEVHIAQKPVCSGWNGGYAIVGVQNATGTSATTAPGRDYPSVWTIPPTEAWRFTPAIGGGSYTVASIPFAPVPYATSLIYWYNASTGAYLGTGDTITVCPVTATTYKAGALGCGADTSFGYYTVTPSGSIFITTTSSNPSKCGLCDGTITVHGLTPGLIDTVDYMLGGVPQPRVTATVSGGGTITITGLCSGTYTNIIARQGACASLPAGPVVLVDPPISISSVTTTDPTKCGLCDGTMTLNGLYPGHAFTVNYNFNGVAQAPVSTSTTGGGSITLTGLCAGVYDNIVASFGACVTPPVGPFTLTDPPPPPVNLTNSVNPTECGFCNGSITLRAVAPFSVDTVFYSLNGTAQPPIVTVALADSSILLSGLCVGAYTSFSVKIGPCLAPVVGSATLTAPPLFAIFDTAVHYGCHGDSVYFFNSSVSAGPLFYIWTFGDGSSDTATNPMHIFAQGTYTVTLVATNHKCADSTDTVISLIHPLKAAFIDSPNILCQGNPVTFTNSSTDASVWPFTYLWKFGDGNTDTATNPVHIFKNSGIYKVQLIATNFVPCKDTTTQIVYVDSLSPITMHVTDSVLCKSTYVTFTGLYTSIGNTGITWYFDDGDSIKNVNPVTHAFDRAGTYIVWATAHFRSCKDTTVKKTVNVFPPPSVSLGADTSICPGSKSIILKDHINVNTAGAKWKWNTGQTTPSITVVEPGSYSVIVDINGCSSTDTIWVQNDCYINIPNVFTPNGDGLNDYFFPREYLTKGLTSFSMDIYNRWGQLIFQTNSIDGKGWDGKLNDVPQPVGVYVYVIDATFKDGQKEHHQGNVSLLR
jgi:gliding motility-associated-like protein